MESDIPVASSSNENPLTGPQSRRFLDDTVPSLHNEPNENDPVTNLSESTPLTKRSRLRQACERCKRRKQKVRESRVLMTRWT